MSESPSWWDWLFWLTTISLMFALFASGSMVGNCATCLMIAGIAAMSLICAIQLIRLILPGSPARSGNQVSEGSVKSTEETGRDAMLIYAGTDGKIDWEGCAHGPEYDPDVDDPVDPEFDDYAGDDDNPAKWGIDD
jgi:hypothetical protein